MSAQPLNQNSQRLREYKQRGRIREEPGPRGTREKERQKDMSKEAFRSDPDAELTSDDPRRGGRLESSDKCEAQISPPSASQKHAARDGRKKNSHFSTDREAIGSSKSSTDCNNGSNASVSVIVAPRAKEKGELSFSAPRRDHRGTSKDTQRTGGSTKKHEVKNRIPWWPELINKRKGHDVKTKSTTEAPGLNEACRLKNAEDKKLIDSILTMRNDNTTWLEFNEECHDSKTIVENMREALERQEIDEDDEYHDSFIDLEDLNTTQSKR